MTGRVTGFFRSILSPNYSYKMDEILKNSLERHGYTRTFSCHKIIPDIITTTDCRHDIYTKKGRNKTKIIVVGEFYSLLELDEPLTHKKSLVDICPYKIKYGKDKYAIHKKGDNLAFPNEAYERLSQITTDELMGMLEEDSGLV